MWTVPLTDAFYFSPLMDGIEIIVTANALFKFAKRFTT